MNRRSVVEGRYDKNTLSQIVDTVIFQTNGFSVIHDRELLALLRCAAQTRGLIILTDSDGAGLVIRNFLRGALPKEGVLHAYVPEIAGKEKRKAAPGKGGAARRGGHDAGDPLRGAAKCGRGDGRRSQNGGRPYWKMDLYTLGLSGGAGSAGKRQALLQDLGLPGYLSANALVDALNLRMTREELYARYGERQ